MLNKFGGIVACVILCGLLPWLGCSNHQPEPLLPSLNYSLSAFFNPQMINTVVVMPLQNQTSTKKIEEGIREELILQLIGTDRYDVVDRYRLRELLEMQGSTGFEVDSRLVKKIESQFKADAIILGKVTEYSLGSSQWKLLHKAPVLGLSLRMVSVKTGQTLWTVNEAFNGGDNILQRRVDTTLKKRLARDMQVLTQVACSEIAETLNF